VFGELKKPLEAAHETHPPSEAEARRARNFEQELEKAALRGRISKLAQEASALRQTQYERREALAQQELMHQYGLEQRRKEFEALAQAERVLLPALAELAQKPAVKALSARIPEGQYLEVAGRLALTKDGFRAVLSNSIPPEDFEHRWWSVSLAPVKAGDVKHLQLSDVENRLISVAQNLPNRFERTGVQKSLIWNELQ